MAKLVFFATVFLINSKYKIANIKTAGNTLAAVYFNKS